LRDKVARCDITLTAITDAGGSRCVGRVISGVCYVVCLSVRMRVRPRSERKTA